MVERREKERGVDDQLFGPLCLFEGHKVRDLKRERKERVLTDKDLLGFTLCVEMRREDDP